MHMNIIILTSGKEVKGMFPDTDWRVEYWNGQITIRSTNANIRIMDDASVDKKIDAIPVEFMPVGWDDPTKKWEYDFATGTWTEVFDEPGSATVVETSA